MSRLIHTGQVVVDMTLRLPRLPEPGGVIWAQSQGMAAGGAFNVLAAARRDGADAVYAGAIGQGPLAEMARVALAAEGIVRTGPVISDRDTGFSLALVDDAAERTFVSSAGAETQVGPSGEVAIGARPGDVVYVGGYSLAHPAKAAALRRAVAALPPGVRLLVDPSPLVGELPAKVWEWLVGRADIWSMNLREAAALARVLAGAPSGGAADGRADAVHLAQALAETLGGTVVVRRGAAGAVVAAQFGPNAAPPLALPAFPVKAVDTNGAGDTHCGVLVAALLRGASLIEAAHRAGVAAALSTTRPGPATAPTAAETDQALAQEAQTRSLHATAADVL
ncbi:MAG: PfkB family carbohydrate kinase [Bifidobacteriaceae bacterium]|jgi:sugar/nucleoside kinase (ribokinase family)|nr:PfkB family carbohydrate kinase [Bifidobacteriaceae bacterium]